MVDWMLFKLLFLVIVTELFMKYQIGMRLLEEEYLEFSGKFNLWISDKMLLIFVLVYY